MEFGIGRSGEPIIHKSLYKTLTKLAKHGKIVLSLNSNSRTNLMSDWNCGQINIFFKKNICKTLVSKVSYQQTRTSGQQTRDCGAVSRHWSPPGAGAAEPQLTPARLQPADHVLPGTLTSHHRLVFPPVCRATSRPTDHLQTLKPAPSNLAT